MLDDPNFDMRVGRPGHSRAGANETALNQPNESFRAEALHRIVVVGGGAAGLELVTRLGDRLDRHRRASVTLVESARTHLWKPLLHEVAAGASTPASTR